MSVAFRREGDEEHLEPKFEIPLPPGPNWVTPHGLELIAARVAAGEAALPLVSGEAEIAAARRELRYWRVRLATAEPMPCPTGDVVAFGCRVDFLLAGKPRSITITGYDEADAAADRLAISAPLARALIGAEVGDLVDFNGRTEAIEVLAIAPAF